MEGRDSSDDEPSIPRRWHRATAYGLSHLDLDLQADHSQLMSKLPMKMQCL